MGSGEEGGRGSGGEGGRGQAERRGMWSGGEEGDGVRRRGGVGVQAWRGEGTLGYGSASGRVTSCGLVGQGAARAASGHEIADVARVGGGRAGGHGNPRHDL